MKMNRREWIAIVPVPSSLRRDGDSNPGYAFDVYTLSRRASSATRASLLSFDGSFHLPKISTFCLVGRLQAHNSRQK